MMPRLFISVFTLAFSPLASAEAPADIVRCTKIAEKYSSNPFALELSEIDALRTCLNWQYAATVNDAEQRRIDRAIERNFGSRNSGDK